MSKGRPRNASRLFRDKVASGQWTRERDILESAMVSKLKTSPDEEARLAEQAKTFPVTKCRPSNRRLGLGWQRPKPSLPRR